MVSGRCWSVQMKRTFFGRFGCWGMQHSYDCDSGAGLLGEGLALRQERLPLPFRRRHGLPHAELPGEQKAELLADSGFDLVPIADHRVGAGVLRGVQEDALVRRWLRRI